MSDTPRHDDPDWLREQYLEHERSLQDIADLCEASHATIRRRLESFDIPIRSKTESLRTNSNEHLRDKDWLRKKYCEEELHTTEIADLVGASAGTVGQWLCRHNISRRSVGESHRRDTPDELKDEAWLRSQYEQAGLTTYEIADRVGCDQKTVLNYMDEFEIDRPGPDRRKDPRTPEELKDAGWLREKHHDEKQTISAIARELDVDRGTVRSWFDIHEIDVKQGGAHHPNWKGGVSDTREEYGSLWQRQREKALRRDLYRCQDCRINDASHREQYGQGLDVHHIESVDAFETEGDAHQVENLVSLCRPCHMEREQSS